MVEFKIKSLDEYKKVLDYIIKKKSKIILFNGDLGSGKTTLIKLICKKLHVKENVLSPTFNIVYDYEVGKKKFLHYDLYRLKNYKEISQLGMFETSNTHIKIIEWPELINPKPKDRIDIKFTYAKKTNYRQVKILGFGKWKKNEFFKI